MATMEILMKEITNHLLQVWNIQQCLLTTSSSSFSSTFLHCFVSYDALDISLWFVAIFILYSFIWSIIGNNCSKVDQIWSIVPWIYMWIFFFHYYLLHQIIHYRLLLVTILTTLWGIRLTYNFWRRGGYGTFFTHEEDYRWPIIRSKMHPILFLIFNLTFIATYQNILLWFIATPGYIILHTDPNPSNINLYDVFLIFLFLFFLIYETIADQQQYNFQQYKYSLTINERKQHKLESIRQGFLSNGLFQYCRHPNYFAEQSLWICIYLFSITTATTPNNYINWTILGCIQLILLFQGSTRFSESITAEKYPAYRIYQQEVSQTIPWFKFQKINKKSS